MSSLLKNSELTSEKADNIVSETLNKCDDGELYLENSKSESIVLDDGKIKNSTYSSDLGYGLRAVTGEVVAYSHSNEISKKCNVSLDTKGYFLPEYPVPKNHDFDSYLVDLSNKRLQDYIDKFEKSFSISESAVSRQISKRRWSHLHLKLSNSFQWQRKAIKVNVESGNE